MKRRVEVSRITVDASVSLVREADHRPDRNACHQTP
jgi:hypothetical protein